MAKIKLIIDKRRSNRDKLYPIRIYIYHRQQIYIPTGMTAALHEWNPDAGLLYGTNPSTRAKNARLRDMLNKCEMILLNLTVKDELEKMTAKMLTLHVQQAISMSSRSRALLVDYLEKAKNGKAERTKKLYAWAQQRVEDFDAKACVADIDENWLTRFRDSMINDGYAPNTVAQGLSWVSRALSLAIADGLLTRNPCSGVRKPRAETRKKYLPLEKMRMLRDMTFEQKAYNPEDVVVWEYARDIFLLQFYLLGINVVDLMELGEIVNGRVDYRRHKTKTLYSVKVEPEAMEIIERWRGKNSLIRNRCNSAASACSQLTSYLKKMVPKLSTNWARHTWASMAAELEIPMETISHALGHKIGSPVTAIYVAYNQKKVDAANRRVIDYLNADLKGKSAQKPHVEAQKKCLSLEKMRVLRDMTFEQKAFNPKNVTVWEYTRDIFLLQFYLLGINVMDLMELGEIVDGRVNYKRYGVKTLYSVKVEPEAMEIIERWRGKNSLIHNRCNSAASTYGQLTKYLKRMMPNLATSWARHTWASIATELEIPMETISHALGHKIDTFTTAMCDACDQKKVDEANRRVIDYLNADLKGKK